MPPEDQYLRLSSPNWVMNASQGRPGRRCCPHSTDFQLADFGLGRPVTDYRTALEDMCKVERISQHLDALSALVQQCGRDWGDKTQYLNSYIFVGRERERPPLHAFLLMYFMGWSC